MAMCPIPIDEETLFFPPHPSTDFVFHCPSTPSELKRSYVFPPPHRTPNSRGSRDRSRSPSPSPRWTRPRPRSFSPARYTHTINAPLPSPSPIPIVQSGPSPVVLPPSWYTEPPSGAWPTQVPKQPADILTLNYNNSFAYAPAAKTYDVRPLTHSFGFSHLCECVCMCNLTEHSCPFAGGNRYCVGALARATRRRA